MTGMPIMHNNMAWASHYYNKYGKIVSSLKQKCECYYDVVYTVKLVASQNVMENSSIAKYCSDY